MDTRHSRLLAARAAAGSLAVALLTFGAASPSADGNPSGDALARLKAGNARFAADPSQPLPVTAQHRTALAQGQSPFAMVLSCADSRVPPEVVFHTGLGDLFVVRSAGHVTDRSVLASLEYGVEHLHVPLLVVMGHEMCGAVRAAIDSAPGASYGPNIDYLIRMIRPASARVANQPADLRLRLAILENVEETINTIVESSTMLRRQVETNKLLMVGAYYELATGRALFSQPVAVPPSRAAQPVARTSTSSPAAPPRASASSAPTGAPAAGVVGAPASGSGTAAKPAGQAAAPPTKPAAAPVSPARPVAPVAAPAPTTATLQPTKTQ